MWSHACQQWTAVKRRCSTAVAFNIRPFACWILHHWLRHARVFAFVNFLQFFLSMKIFRIAYFALIVVNGCRRGGKGRGAYTWWIDGTYIERTWGGGRDKRQFQGWEPAFKLHQTLQFRQNLRTHLLRTAPPPNTSWLCTILSSCLGAIQKESNHDDVNNLIHHRHYLRWKKGERQTQFHPTAAPFITLVTSLICTRLSQIFLGGDFDLNLLHARSFKQS